MKKNDLKKWMCVAMTACLIGSMTACGGDTEQTSGETNETEKAEAEVTPEAEVEKVESLAGVGVKLEEVGTAEDASQEINFSNGAPLKIKGENEAEFLDYLCKETSDKTYKGLNDIGNGLFEVSEASGSDPNCVGVISQEGEEIFPCEAAKIEFMSGTDSASDRFLRVIYVTEETDNEEEAILYTTDSMFSFGPSEGDTLYKGYLKIYDLDEKRFVPDFEVTNNDKYCLSPCGDNFIYEDENGDSSLMNADGEVVEALGSVYAYTGKTTFTYSDGADNKIFDSNGDVLFESEDMFSVVDGTDYYTTSDGVNTTLITKTGSPVLSVENGTVLEIKENVVRVNENGKNGLLTLDGEEIYMTENDEQYITYLGRGYWSAEESEESYVILSENGVVGKTKGIPTFTEKIEDGDKYKVFIFNDGDYTLSVDDLLYSSFDEEEPIIGVENADRKAALYDTVTGEQLLDYKYDDIQYAAGYIYAYADGKYTIYKVVDAK